MEGLGNDYIYFDFLREDNPICLSEMPSLAARLSHRRFGVGSDGVICIGRSEKADFSMDMYNADGSRGEMCGNGIRCVGKYLYDKGYAQGRELTIDTLAGLKRVWLHVGENGEVETVTVDMGRAELFPRQKCRVRGELVEGVPVSMGNPHFVIFCKDPDRAPVLEIGPLLERSPCFPNRTNVEFLAVEAANRLNLRVWERGSGETLACGTGACAAFAAALAQGDCGADVQVRLPGGILHLSKDVEGHILMGGPAVTVFEGEISI